MKTRLLVELDVKPEKIAEFQTMFRDEFISRLRQEVGCEQYELWHDLEAPHKMTILEVWTTKADFEAHLKQSWFAEWAPKMEAMQATPLIIRNLESFEG